MNDIAQASLAVLVALTITVVYAATQQAAHQWDQSLTGYGFGSDDPIMVRGLAIVFP